MTKRIEEKLSKYKTTMEFIRTTASIIILILQLVMFSLLTDKGSSQSIPLLSSVTDTSRIAAIIIDSLPTDSLDSLSLPIELEYYDIERSKDGINVVWRTANEYKTVYFFVLKATDVTNFTVLDIAEAKNYPSEYRISDINLLPGFTYYRLVELTRDGDYINHGIRIIYLRPPSPVTEPRFNILGQRVK